MKLLAIGFLLTFTACNDNKCTPPPCPFPGSIDGNTCKCVPSNCTHPTPCPFPGEFDIATCKCLGTTGDLDATADTVDGGT